MRFPATLRRAAISPLSLSVLVLVGLAFGTLVYLSSTGAADTGFLSPTATHTPNNWTNGSNALAQDDVYATETTENDEQGYANFGISIAPGSIIDGITLEYDAKSSDNSDCDMEAALSWNNGSTFTSFLDGPPLPGTDTDTYQSIGSASNDWGHDWSPPDLTNANFVVVVRFDDTADNGGCTNGSTVSLDHLRVKITYRTIDPGTVNPALSSTVCDAADFNFVIDLSGSISAGDLTSMQGAIKDFVDAFEGQGSGLYSGTTYQDSTITDGLPEGAGQAGYVAGTTFKGYIDNIGPTGGRTPTADGIQDAMLNTANDRGGVPNVMFIVTDGSPNIRLNDGSEPALGDPVTWYNGANDAIGQANAARSAGYVVFAIYVGMGDASLPFTSAGDDQFAEEVMKHFDGAGVLRQIAFTSLANELKAAVGCAQFVASEVHDPSHADVTDDTLPPGTVIHDKAIVDGSPINATGTVDFRFFDDHACAVQVSVQNNVPLVGEMAESTPFAPTAGVHAYMVHYDGDGNYDPEDGPCERFTIAATPTPVVTDTPTPVVTESATPVPTDTPAPTDTPSPTPTPTDTPSPTPSPTNTPTPTPSPTPVATTPPVTTAPPTNTPTPTAPPTTPPVTTAPPTPSPTPTPNITGGVTQTPFPTPSGTGPAVGGFVDVVTGGGSDGGSGTMLVLISILFAVAAAGLAVGGYKKASGR
jgi:hypothetical protein